MTKIKICGITRLEDALLVQNLGADAIGFIFYPKSKRYIKPKKAKEIAKEIKIKKIGVFVNEKPKKINEIASLVNLDYTQIYGEINPISLNKPYIKNIKSIDEIEKYKNAILFQIDAIDKNYGGVGKLADWNLAKKIKPLMLSGGITSKNIKQAIEEINPNWIDLSSGVELAQGIKDPKLLKELFETLEKIK